MLNLVDVSGGFAKTKTDSFIGGRMAAARCYAYPRKYWDAVRVTERTKLGNEMLNQPN